MSLFGVGAGEAALVLVLALIVVGPQRFPEIARQGGRWYRLARQYTNEVMQDVRAAVDEIETEIQEETRDLESIASIDTDLRAIRDDVDTVATESAADAEQALSDTAAAAGANGADAPRTLARDSSVRPSRRAQDS